MILNNIKQFVSNNISQIVFKNTQNIVYRYVPKRSPFDKTQYIPNWIPRPNKYHSTRKPRQSQWDDENYVWPRIFPKSVKLTGKNLLREVEQEEKQKIDVQRDFTIPDYRSGDVVQFKFLHSITSDKGNYYTGLVLSRHKKNSLNANSRVVFRFCGVEVYMYLKESSPLLKDFKIIEKGSGNLRRNLCHLWHNKSLTTEQTKKAIIKRTIVGRAGDKKHHKRLSSSQNLLPSGHKNQINDPLFSDEALTTSN